MAANITVEAIPRWLVEWAPEAGSPLEAFFASRVVFYPGSGTDGQPVEFFGMRHLAHCFVYVDYGVSCDDFARELADDGHPYMGYRSIDRIEIRVHDLVRHRWSRHVKHLDGPSGAWGAEAPYAFMEILERKPGFGRRHGPQRLAVLFLHADGIAAYDLLFCQRRPGVNTPYAVVLQDHGFGGNYTTFGKGGCLDELATRSTQLPEFLLVADNTVAWDGYVALQRQVARGGGMHRHTRRLWRLVREELQWRTAAT
jgi:hypothetical protein